MNCIFIISVSVLCVSNSLSDPLSDDIKEYFNSNSVKRIRRVWDDYRKSIEVGLENALHKNVNDELNTYNVKPTDLKLSRAYLHKQGPVEVIFQNLDLKALPCTFIPHVSLALDSNVLKIETILTNMVINAEYMLMRNKSYMIEDTVNKDPYRYSPFLLKEVPNTGNVSIWVDHCVLSGYMIAKLKGGTVKLGHEKFTLSKCEYTLEIFNNNTRAFTVRYSVMKPAHSLGIKHFLLKAIKNKFITKLQKAIFNMVNTSTIFGLNRHIYENEQRILILKTLGNMTTLIKEQNRKIINLNGGTVNIPDYFCTWDDTDNSFVTENSKPAELRLSKMVLSGLGNAIYSNTGGPYKFNAMMIGEQKRFMSLQVRGEVSSHPKNRDTRQFSVKISDFDINIDIDTETKGKKQAKIDVVGYRDIFFDRSDKISEPLQTLIIGYLMDQVPKAIVETVADVSNMPAPAPINMGVKSQSRKTKSSVPGLSGEYSRTNISVPDTGFKSKFLKKIYEPLSNNGIWKTLLYKYF